MKSLKMQEKECVERQTIKQYIIQIIKITGTNLMLTGCRFKGKKKHCFIFF